MISHSGVMSESLKTMSRGKKGASVIVDPQDTSKLFRGFDLTRSPDVGDKRNDISAAAAGRKVRPQAGTYIDAEAADVAVCAGNRTSSVVVTCRCAENQGFRRKLIEPRTQKTTKPSRARFDAPFFI